MRKLLSKGEKPLSIEAFKKRKYLEFLHWFCFYVNIWMGAVENRTLLFPHMYKNYINHFYIYSSTKITAVIYFTTSAMQRYVINNVMLLPQLFQTNLQLERSLFTFSHLSPCITIVQYMRSNTVSMKMFCVQLCAVFCMCQVNFVNHVARSSKALLTFWSAFSISYWKKCV